MLAALALSWYSNCSGNLESGGEGVEGEADTARHSILNMSVVTVFGLILTYGDFKAHSTVGMSPSLWD